MTGTRRKVLQLCLHRFIGGLAGVCAQNANGTFNRIRHYLRAKLEARRHVGLATQLVALLSLLEALVSVLLPPFPQPL